MGLWNRVKGAFRGPPPPLPAAALASPVMPPEEAYLRHLLGRLAPLEAGTSTGAAPGTPPSFGGREFWSAVEHLIASGRERTVTELLRRFAAARPEDADLAARLAELLCDGVDFAAAIPVLERLTSVPERAQRAHFLLGEALERTGRPDEARRHYEAVLALDLEHPNARARADRLRRDLGGPSPAPPGEAAPTLLGVAGAAADLDARYRLVREIGRGAAGAVYLARDLELDCEVALKLLHPNARSRAEARALSFNEARLAAALRHPGVVAIYDLDEERNLIAMELCRGGTLRERLQRGRLVPGEALRLGAELLGTLAAVHRAGIVHLDLKPGNLLFRAPPAGAATDGADDDLVLADFGLANLEVPAGGGTGELERAADAAGTLAYMAPERRRGALSSRVDIYAAGVILHEMLVGGCHVDRAALLRGDRWLGGPLPDAVATQLGNTNQEVTALLAALTDADPDRRPDAPHAAARLAQLRSAVPA